MDKKEHIALCIVERLQESGYDAYWVGGCVRNMLMGLPSDDIDIATSAPAEIVMNHFPRTIPVGVQFGVVIILENDVQTEVATFRSDGEYLDYRHPVEVHFSSAKEDAKRRDFTINSLFYDPVKKELYDFVEGRKDLKAGIIRCIGDPDKRFREDPLRMLRAIRFANRYDFTIEPDTWKALKMNAFLIEHVSKERIREELTKTFSGPKAGMALKRMDESGMLRIILPEVADMKGVSQPEKFHPEGDVFEHTVLAMNMLENPTPTLAFGVLLHDIGKPKTYEKTDRIRFNLHNKVGKEIANNVCKRLGFSNKNRKHIIALVDRHMAFLNIRDMRSSTLKRFLSAPTIEEDIELHRIDCLASHGDASNCDFCREKLEEFRQEHEEIIPPPLLTGRDLIDMGYSPGPQFKEILDAVEEAQLEKKITTKEAAISFIRQFFSTHE